MGKTCSMAKLALDWQPGQYILLVHIRVDKCLSYCIVLLFKYVRDTETYISLHILSDLLHLPLCILSIKVTLYQMHKVFVNFTLSKN